MPLRGFYQVGKSGGIKKCGKPTEFGSFPTKRGQPNYFLAGALGVELAGASLVAGAAVFFLTCFLCFFTFVVLGEAGALGVGVWAARDRAAARAVPNIKVVKRFIVFSFWGVFLCPQYMRRSDQLTRP
jgi:hypothetical protein